MIAPGDKRAHVDLKPSPGDLELSVSTAKLLGHDNSGVAMIDDPSVVALLRLLKPNRGKSLDDLLRDWLDRPRIAAISRNHELSPLLYHRLTRKGLETQLPPPALDALRMQYPLTSAIDMEIYSELREIFRELELAGIPVILLKGAYIAWFVYKNEALRLMVDIDFLVRSEDHVAAARVLTEKSGLNR